MFHNMVNALTGEDNKNKLRGTVVLMKKNVLDFNDFTASFLDRVHEFVGKGVSLQLISAVNVDPGKYYSIVIIIIFLGFSLYNPLFLLSNSSKLTKSIKRQSWDVFTFD